MANIAATDVTVTVLNRRTMDSGRKSMNLQLAFGNGVLTYPAGGIPVTKAQLGLPNAVESLVVYDGSEGGYAWSWDATNSKLFALADGGGAAGTPLAQPSTVAIAAQTLRCEALGW